MPRTPLSYTDKVLQASASDMLYKVNYLKHEGLAYLCILTEHQSTVDELMPLRLWRYVISVWNECLKKNKGAKLPLVITLVFYNGKTRYDGPRDIRELIDAPQELIEQCLLKPFYLIDTHDIQDEELRKQHWLGLMQFCLKHAHEKEALNCIQLFLELLKRVVEDNGGTDFAISVLKYFLSQAETGDPNRLFKPLKQGYQRLKKVQLWQQLNNILLKKTNNLG